MKKITFLLLLFLGFTTLQAQKTSLNDDTSMDIGEAIIVQKNVATATMLAARTPVSNTTNMAPAAIPELLYYKFDEAGATVTNMASSPPGGTATATILGSLSQGVPAICDAGSLQGTGSSSSSNYVDTGWDTNLGSGSWTIAFKTQDIAPSGTLYYIFGDPAASSFRCFTNGVAGAGNWWLRGPVTDVPLPGGAAVAGTTNVFVYDSAASEVRAYLDGVLVNTVAQGAVSISGSAFKVGAYSSSTGLAPGAAMDEFRVYNRALSPAEVADLTPCSAPPSGAGALFSVTSNDDQLREIDESDASTLNSTTITLAGATVNGATGLATDPTTGTMWAMLKAGGLGFTGRALVTIDSGTGVATLVGDTQESFAGMAFDAAGTLYGVTGDGSATPETLFTLNKGTGAPTFVCTLGNGNDGEALGYNPVDGLLYHASGHTGANVIFETISNSTINPCGVTNIDITGTALEDEETQALTWDAANGAFLWKQDHGTGPLYSVTPTGVPTLIGNMDHQAKGLAFSNVVVGAPPIIICPGDIMQGTDAGVCGAVVNFGAAVALDPEDGPIPTTQTGGPASGS
ncbi:MAG: LamG domain-containing protein, partial [Altibacter sp.]|uniref:LamG-like jellyroll fold domain-containing protein n=1 Tax=Altibacter sp. TaxID=2024823 RepID=UPI001DA808C3